MLVLLTLLPVRAYNKECILIRSPSANGGNMASDFPYVLYCFQESYSPAPDGQI